MQFTQFSFKYDVITQLLTPVLRNHAPGTPEPTVRQLLTALIYHWHARCDGCGQVITSLDGEPSCADRNSWLHSNGTRSCKSAMTWDDYPGDHADRQSDTRLARPDRSSRATDGQGGDGRGTDLREGCALCAIGRELLTTRTGDRS